MNYPLGKMKAVNGDISSGFISSMKDKELTNDREEQMMKLKEKIRVLEQKIAETNSRKAKIMNGESVKNA